MFSPASRKRQFAAPKDRKPRLAAPDSPKTPAADNRGSSSAAAVPSRPATGTPAPWASRLSVVARIPSNEKSDKGVDGDQIHPVYVGEVPPIVRKAQDDYILRRKIYGDVGFSGGLDKGSSLSWIICENQLFIWSYLTPLSKNCAVLDIPTSVLGTRNTTADCSDNNNWMVYIIEWNATCADKDGVVDRCNSAGAIICHKKTHCIVYWPDIFSESGRVPVTWFPNLEQNSQHSSFSGKKVSDNEHQDQSCDESGYVAEHSSLNSIIASAIPASWHESIAVACRSNGELWLFHCTPTGIFQKIHQLSLDDFHSNSVNARIGQVYAKSLTWRFQYLSSDVPNRQFFLLTDREIQSWNITIAPDSKVTKLWSHEIVGNDGDLGIKKDLAGQKHIWLLDMQVDDRGKELAILVATFCKDRTSSSSYMQYSLLTMQYRSEQNMSTEGYKSGRVLEKKAPLQVIIPKARVENESFLFSMRLRVGGKPSGSVVIISGDGTATVANYWRGSTRLYKFDLSWDAGKVLGASVLPSIGDGEEGAWVVLTEKAGVWAIPEKVVLLGGVEPPERSLSRKGSSNEEITEDEKRNQGFGSTIAPRKSSIEAWSAGDRQAAVLARIAHRTALDEEAEVLLTQLFHDFLLTGKVEDAFEKLRKSGAFDKEGETNVFARMSKSIVDTLAKHWTMTKGEEFVASAIIASQLLDKQQKHERFLQFLALSKCHEELSSMQRDALQIIVEHGEKLFAMIQLRELQNFLSQKPPKEDQSASSFSFNEASGSLWDLIQLVGEKARRNTVLLMDRDNAEVFYSKVSDLEELFYCISHHISYVVGENQHYLIQIHRAYEISNACITLIQAAVQYRHEHRTWYPPPEGLTSWNCEPKVRTGLWSLASLIMQLLKEASTNQLSVRSGLCAKLEGLTDIILEAYISSITAKGERNEECRGLVEEYHKRRDALLDSLYLEALRFADVQYQELCKGSEDSKLKEDIFREVSFPVLSVAKRHEGYQTLWNICYELHDTGLLRSLMREGLGPKGGFSNFVFQKLHQMQQYSKLLRLGEEFQDKLTSYLKQHKKLLWLHEVFLNHFPSASDTLHALALSHDEDDSLTLVEEGSKGGCSKCNSSHPTLAERRKFLNLSKISALAGKGAGFEMKIQRIEADLQILALQEEIMQQIPDDIEKEVSNIPLSPFELIEICLKANRKTRELSLLAFEVFAWTSSSFRASNKGLLEECWRNAINQDDWVALHQRSLSEGWSDEVSLQYLQKTVLFQASRRCYGPEAETYEGTFDEVLPLQEEDVQLPTLKGPCSSVGGILMQHQHFPDAGKLMVTAIVMGKVEADVEVAMELQ